MAPKWLMMNGSILFLNEFPVTSVGKVDYRKLEQKAAKETKAYLADISLKNLSETDVPMDWFFVDILPRNMGGKIDTQKLIESCNIRY